MVNTAESGFLTTTGCRKPMTVQKRPLSSTRARRTACFSVSSISRYKSLTSCMALSSCGRRFPRPVQGNGKGAWERGEEGGRDIKGRVIIMEMTSREKGAPIFRGEEEEEQNERWLEHIMINCLRAGGSTRSQTAEWEDGEKLHQSWHEGRKNGCD